MFFVKTLLMVFPDLRVEEVLFVFECLTSADIIQQELCESGGDYIALIAHEFDRWLTAVIDNKQLIGQISVVVITGRLIV
jgi:hypothetical protein